MIDTFKVGDTIVYLEKCNGKECKYRVDQVFRSFIVCINAESGKIKHIYREFYGNVKKKSS